MKLSGLTGAGLLTLPAGLFAAQEGGGLFSVDPGLSIWTIVVFLLVLFVLGKWAWGPILGALDAREEGIRSAIEEAKAERLEAQELLAEHRRQVADARRQAQEIVSEAREAGQRIQKDIEARAREEGDRILARARVEIERERDRAIEELRRESVDLALAVAARVLDEKLTGEKDRALVRAYLEEIRTPAVEA